MTLKALFTIVVVLAVILLPQFSFAQGQPVNNVLDEVVNVFRESTGGWEDTLRGLALNLFLLLLAIDLALTSIRLVIKGAPLDEWVANLVQQMLFVGFMFLLLLYGAEWSAAIVSSFREAATLADGSAGLSPSNIMESGLKIALEVFSSLSLSIRGLAMLVASIVIVYCFAQIAANVIMALVESYLVMSIGVLFMGFGGASFTSETSIKFFRYALGIGTKLFTLQLLAGIGTTIISDIAAKADTDFAWSAVLVCCCLVLLTLIISIPDMLMQMVSGATSNAGRNLISVTTSAAVSTMAAMKVGAAQTAGGGGAIAAAVKAASGGVDPGASMVEKVGQLAAGTMGHLGTAATSAAGEAANNFGAGTAGGVLKSHINQAAETAAGSSPGSIEPNGGN